MGDAGSRKGDLCETIDCVSRAVRGSGVRKLDAGDQVALVHLRDESCRQDAQFESTETEQAAIENQHYQRQTHCSSDDPKVATLHAVERRIEDSKESADGVDVESIRVGFF